MIFLLCYIFQIKQRATGQIFRPVMEIIEDVVKDVSLEERFLLPKQSVLKRVANRHRKKSRPQEPSDLDFNVSKT